MPLSTLSRNPKFLVDENVHRKLFNYLNENKIDVILAPTSATDKDIAVISKKEKRIIITNDEDFFEFSGAEIYSFIWLRITQGDSKGLILAFNKLLKECKLFSGYAIVLTGAQWKQIPLILKA